MTDLLLIESYYNNNINEELINKYKNNILFCYIDQKNLNLLINKFQIINYYSFFDIIKDYKNYNIINYYDLGNNTGLNDFIISKNKGEIKLIDISNKLLWSDFYSEIKYKFIYNKNSYKWNIIL
jgi:hypothetical protein